LVVTTYSRCITCIFPQFNLVRRKICNSGFIKRTYYSFIILLYTPYNMLHLFSLFIYVSFKRLELIGVTYIGDIRCGRSEAGPVARCRTTLLFLSTLKLTRNFAFASWISCSLCSSNWSCSSAGKVFQVGSIILLGRYQSYPLNRPLRADLMSLDVFSLAESPKSVLVPFWGANHYVRTGGGARCIGADGPRHGTGLRVSCLTTGRSAHAQGRRKSPAALVSRSREGPRRGGEIIGVV
jgi:hypothetical protein